MGQKNLEDALKPLIFKGMEITKYEEGNGDIEIQMDVTEDMMNPNGILHGGMSFTLSDMCAGLGAFCLGYRVSTIQSNINFIRPVTSGRIIGRSYVKHQGRTTMVSNVEIRNEEGKLISSSSFTMALLEKIEK